MLFRHLFHCKNVEREINNLWRVNMSIYKQAEWFRRSIFQVLTMMKSFVTTLQYFMSTEVIEPNWQKFVNSLNKVNDLDELLECQTEFLDNCIKSCLISESKLLCAITNLLSCSLRFCTFVHKVLPDPEVDSNLPERDFITNQIADFKTDFSINMHKFLKHLTKISQRSSEQILHALLSKLNYNFFYDFQA